MRIAIKGYDFGKASLAQSPVSLQDLELLKKTVLWSEADEANLRKAGEVLGSQTDAVLDLWYGFFDGAIRTFMKASSDMNNWLKKIGIAGFLFFLIKGLVWLFLIFAIGKKL